MIDRTQDDADAHRDQDNHSVEKVSWDAEESHLDASIVIAVEKLAPFTIQLG